MDLYIHNTNCCNHKCSIVKIFCIVPWVLAVSLSSQASNLNQLHESIGYYSSSHDVLNWLSGTSECGYIFKKGRVPVIEEVQANIIEVLPHRQQQAWLDYYHSDQTKSKYAKTRQIVIDLYREFIKSGMDSNTACGMISAKVLDEFDTARNLFKNASKAYR